MSYKKLEVALDVGIGTMRGNKRFKRYKDVVGARSHNIPKGFHTRSDTGGWILEAEEKQSKRDQDA